MRILLVNEFEEVLLVRSWFGHQSWSLPGGGIQRNETPLYAAIRELQEETGLTLKPSAIAELGSFTNPYKVAPFTVACFVATTARQEPSLSRQRRLEVLDTGWFAITHLPRDLSPTVKKALKLRTEQNLV